MSQLLLIFVLVLTFPNILLPQADLLNTLPLVACKTAQKLVLIMLMCAVVYLLNKLLCFKPLPPTPPTPQASLVRLQFLSFEIIYGFSTPSLSPSKFPMDLPLNGGGYNFLKLQDKIIINFH